MSRFRLLTLSIAITLGTMANAHVGNHPSVHDVTAGVIDRMKETLDPEDLMKLRPQQVLEFLTDVEREVLGEHYLTFDVDVPVVLSVMRDEKLGAEPFWLEDRTFAKTNLRVKAGGRYYDVWEKSFEKGTVGLGLNTISGRGEHYFVAMRPVNSGDSVNVTNVYPGSHRLRTMKLGTLAYSDGGDKLEEIPAELEGQVLLQGRDDRRRETKMIDIFRTTPYPASAEPDHVVLTWSEDPKSTQTIQWRVSTEVDKGVVEYMRKADFERFRPRQPKRVDAALAVMNTPTLVNDPVVHRFTATLRDLEAATTYVYSVGDGSESGWSSQGEFTTAPEIVEPFSFIYMGDAQNGLERWGSLIQQSHIRRPESKFFVMAGDLVNRGQDRDDWDTYFENAMGVFEHRQIITVPGNHEYQGGDCQMYLEMFTLPEGSPVGEKAYTIEYSNALFVMLDSNISATTQAEWLDKVLGESDATWKFVVYHHPAYSSAPRRNNLGVRKVWGPIFDKHHVDVALQGHDHAYLRTYPMKDEQRAASAEEGTIYIVSVSGTKFYDQGDFDYTEFGMTNVATYQLLDIQISGDRLVYRAFDVEGNVRDHFIIEK